MKKFLVLFAALLILSSFVPAPPAGAEREPGYYTAYDTSYEYVLTPEELRDLLSPIALYPDPLIAQILPAATFIDEIQEAADFVRRYGRSPRIDYRPWDVSV